MSRTTDREVFRALGLSHADELRAHVAVEDVPVVVVALRTEHAITMAQLMRLALRHPAVGPGTAAAGEMVLASIQRGLPEPLKKLAGELHLAAPAAPIGVEAAGAEKRNHTPVTQQED